MAKEREGRQLHKVVGRVIERWKNQKVIAPAWVANEAYRRIEPRNKATLLTKMAALLALKQIARELLRDKFEPQENPAEQHPLFPGLQLRYPMAHSPASEPSYVPLELVSLEDWIYNLERMEKELTTKQKHHDDFENWGNSVGYFRDKAV